MKQENILIELTLSGSHHKRSTNYNNDEASTDDIIGSITACWFEEVDTVLWDHELVLLRLGEVAKKKKIALAMAQQIAQHLNALVAQVVGHTALLYRPGAPPILDLERLQLK
jgi:RNA-binding protein YhbY